jgi:hypothetical protein
MPLFAFVLVLDLAAAASLLGVGISEIPPRPISSPLYPGLRQSVVMSRLMA